jgi:hypothetical protein
MDKKGQLGEQIMMFAFIFLIVVIGAGIVLGVYMFIGQGFDFRSGEAGLLAYNVKDCILNEGSSWFSELKTNPDLLYSKCKLSKAVIEDNNALRICPQAAEVADCLNPDSSHVAFSSGNYALCDPAGSNKLVGCSVLSFAKDNVNYIVIATSKQKIRRSAR